MTAALLAIVVFYLASVNAVLALVVGTCTQGNAGRLWGGLVTLLLYLIGAVLLRRSDRPVVGAIALVPLTPLFAWEAFFSVEFAAGYWLNGSSACDVLEGTVGYWMDGDEALFVPLWIAIPLVAWWTFGSLVVRGLSSTGSKVPSGPLDAD